MSTADPHNEEHADGIVEDREKAPPVYFNVLFYGLIIWGIAFMSFYLLSGWSSDAELKEKMAIHKGESPAPAEAASPAVPQTDAEVVVADARALYKKHCAGCHGSNGKGAFGPDLSGEYKYGKNPMAVQESIASGRPKNMPGFGQKLSREEIDTLTEFILSL